MEAEFGGGVCKVIFVSNPPLVRLCWVELMLSWGFDNLYTEQILTSTDSMRSIDNGENRVQREGKDK